MSKKLLKSLPPPDHKYGYYKESVEEYALRWGINREQLWKEFREMPLVRELRTGKLLFDADDIVKVVIRLLKTRSIPTDSARSRASLS
jgi:hypothetical protein